jgi:hypothetical protein
VVSSEAMWLTVSLIAVDNALWSPGWLSTCGVALVRVGGGRVGG